MRSISAEEMSALDSNCRYFGLLPLQLMENAGAALARQARSMTRGSRIAIVAGRGNNGGDAFVAARHLSGHGLSVTVYLLGRVRDIATEEARRNWDILKNLDFDLREIRDACELSLGQCDLIIDAIFGTGVRGIITGLEADAIDAINSSGRAVLSADVPSGLSSNKTVKADAIVTFHRHKLGQSEDVVLADIGIPPAAETFTGVGDLMLLGRRKAASHKGDSGRILVIGGGPYTGAPALSALAALRAGADIVTVAAPGTAARTISTFSPNLIVRELSFGHLCPDDVPFLTEQIAGHDVVVMGMGLGRHPETASALREIIAICKSLGKKTVIDADALQAELPLQGILTPHAGEFQRISGISLADREYRERAGPVKEYARQKGLVVLLKGRIDLITDGEVLRANATGNPGMTVGGTGDVLAGIVAAFYARASAIRAAAAAAFVNGRAGDLAFCERDFGMVATDLIDRIPDAMRL
ncbi:MAG TPA: NAD(P)H-hydrate dehydratase [Methanothrix sp.]|nr:NAD(P)H-hydrate dehydratase [Methanothrix sp.]HPT18491.1 NAD(P)H-hydrate dehydratase [Methanothrix sp.]